MTAGIILQFFLMTLSTLQEIQVPADVRLLYQRGYTPGKAIQREEKVPNISCDGTVQTQMANTLKMLFA